MLPYFRSMEAFSHYDIFHYITRLKLLKKNDLKHLLVKKKVLTLAH